MQMKAIEGIPREGSIAANDLAVSINADEEVLSMFSQGLFHDDLLHISLGLIRASYCSSINENHHRHRNHQISGRKRLFTYSVFSSVPRRLRS